MQDIIHYNYLLTDLLCWYFPFSVSVLIKEHLFHS